MRTIPTLLAAAVIAVGPPVLAVSVTPPPIAHACEWVYPEPTNPCPPPPIQPQQCSDSWFSSLPKCGTPCTGANYFDKNGDLQHSPPGCEPNAPTP